MKWGPRGRNKTGSKDFHVHGRQEHWDTIVIKKAEHQGLIDSMVHMMEIIQMLEGRLKEAMEHEQDLEQQIKHQNMIIQRNDQKLIVESGIEDSTFLVDRIVRRGYVIHQLGKLRVV